MRTMLKSKIHRATVTGADIEYEGSITLDPTLMDAADIAEFEQVHVVDITNGARLVTYAIKGETGDIVLNGAAARLVTKGDMVIILTYSDLQEHELSAYEPKLVFVDRDNRIANVAHEVPV
jgi:aspartate 1-decarboxylase